MIEICGVSQSVKSPGYSWAQIRFWTHLVFCSRLWLCWLLEKPGFSQCLFPKHKVNCQSYQSNPSDAVDWLQGYSHDLWRTATSDCICAWLSTFWPWTGSKNVRDLCQANGLIRQYISIQITIKISCFHKGKKVITLIIKATFFWSKFILSLYIFLCL